MDSLHILLVHDDLLVQHIVSDALRPSGAGLIVADNQVQGIKALWAWPIEIVVTQLSRLTDGEEFLRQAFALRPLAGWVRILDACPAAVIADHGPLVELSQPLRRDAVAWAILELAARRAALAAA